MRLILLFIFYFTTTYLLAQSKTEKTPKAEIKGIEISNLAYDIIDFTLKLTKERCRHDRSPFKSILILKKNDKDYLVEAYGSVAEFIETEGDDGGEECHLFVSSDSNLPISEGEKKLRLTFLDGTTIEKDYKVPGRSKKQPIVHSISRKGAEIGDIVEVIGENFGDRIEDTVVRIDLDINSQIEVGEGNPGNLRPLSITDIKDNKQSLIFSVDRILFKKDFENSFNFFENIFGRTVKYKIISNHYTTNVYALVILGKYWKLIAIGSAILITILFWILLGYLSKSKNLLHAVCVEEISNRYSLSYFQAFAWTMTLFFSYFYIAMGRTFLIRDAKMPDFKASLIILMGISLAGGITSKFLDKTAIKHPDKKPNPSWKDLISNNQDSIDIYKLQLFGFTIICILIYFINLFQADIVDGLPEIHPSLHALFGTTQSGYIAGKLSQEEHSKDKGKKEEIVENSNKESQKIVKTEVIEKPKNKKKK